MPSALLWASLAEEYFYFGVLKSLRAFQNPFFTGEILWSKPRNCILYKYNFWGGFAKAYKKRRFGLQNAGKHFLFFAVCAIMTTVLA